MVVAINRILSLRVLEKDVLGSVHVCFSGLNFFYCAHRSSSISLRFAGVFRSLEFLQSYSFLPALLKFHRVDFGGEFFDGALLLVHTA